MVFEWDKQKNLNNIRKPGIDFADSFKIFEQPMLVKIDTRKDYKEKRWIGLGRLADNIVVAVFTKIKSKIRIISIRKANKTERNTYHEKIKPDKL